MLKSIPLSIYYTFHLFVSESTLDISDTQIRRFISRFITNIIRDYYL